jgi:hypothetical protein
VFAGASQVGARGELDVLAAQAGKLGDAQPGLDRDSHQGVVAPAEPVGAIGALQQGVDLLLSQERDGGALMSFDGNRDHAGDQFSVFGMAQRCLSPVGRYPQQVGGWQRISPQSGVLVR